MEAAGRPREVSRTWQVMGGFGVAMGGARWLDREVRRWAACEVGVCEVGAFGVGVRDMQGGVECGWGGGEARW